MVEDKVSALAITTPKKKDKASNTSLTDDGADETAANTNKSKSKKGKADEESPLNKPKNTTTGSFAPGLVEEIKKLADEKLAEEIDKLIEDAPAPTEEEEEEGGKGGDGDDNDDEAEEVTVVEETQPEESDPVLKARKKSRLGGVYAITPCMRECL